MTFEENSATIMNVKDKRQTQLWTIRIQNNEVTATANKKISGLKVGKLTYKNGKWTTNGAQDAKNFLRDAQNVKNLSTITNDLYFALPEDERSKTDYTPTDKNVQSQPSISDLVDSATRTAVNDFPRDPEGFFIGRYPLNQEDTSNFDFFKITCYDYAAGDLGNTSNFFKLTDMDRRKKIRRGVVSLPMQPGISESNNVNWGEDSINPLQLAGANIATKVIDEGANLLTGGGFDLTSILQQGKETGAAAFKSLSPELIKAFFAQQALGANIIGRSTGLTINNNLEVLFNGPQLRTFNYNYRFTPREPKEADKVKQIIRFFKKQMAPKRSNSRIFLKSPNVWKLKYTYKNGDPHPFLNNIKICALTGFNVDYTPDGSYATYEDDGGRGDGSMTSYQVGLSFKEITPIYNDDFWNDDEGKEGTGF